VAGDGFAVVDSDRTARHIASTRQEQQQKTEFLKTGKKTGGILKRTINQIKETKNITISTGTRKAIIPLKRHGTTDTTENRHGWIITGRDSAIRKSGCMFQYCHMVLFPSESAASGFTLIGVFTTAMIRCCGFMSW